MTLAEQIAAFEQMQGRPHLVVESDFMKVIRFQAQMIEKAREALKWVGGHGYAGGKSFADTPIVSEALKALAPDQEMA